MKLTKDSVVQMHHLQQRPENEEEVLIGRPDIGQYIILPLIAIDIIALLNEGRTIGEVEKIASDRMGEFVDVLDFTKDLVSEYQLVHQIDGKVVNEKLELKGHFSWISQRTSQFFLNPLTFAFLTAAFVFGLLVCIWNSKYIPVYSDFFLSSSLVSSLAAGMILSWVLLFLHELAHLMASRSVGVPSRIGISHRLVFLVAETDMSNIILLPAKKRYKPIFAGMAVDGGMFGIGVLLLLLHDVGFLALPSAVIMLIKFCNLNALFSLAFQLMFFMETDVYYAFTTKFKCKNLLHNSRLYIRKCLNLMKEHQLEEWEYIDKDEKKIVKGYSWFYLIGVCWAIAFFLFYVLPLTFTFVSDAIVQTFNSEMISWNFFDGIIILLLSLIEFALLIWSWIKKYQNSRFEKGKYAKNTEVDG
ncbi:PqqD family protein [Metabacillus sp. Hm71]|uniref:PqqD family protein n=1 Tax=Metabacillus sp. Hm71 TaxID=3450743 RepID=UPI003F41FAB2